MEKLSAEMYAVYFSNFSAHAIEYKGIVYPTVEHAYHCLRYTDPHIKQEIMSARSPEMAWEISQKYKSMQMRDFKDRKVEIMEKLLRAKLIQHESVRKALKASGDLQMTKHVFTGPPDNGFWGDGDDGRGENQHGRLWMELRAEQR